MKKLFFLSIVVMALFFANFTEKLHDRVSRAEAATVFDASNLPASLSRMHLALALENIGNDSLPFKGQDNMIQFNAGGHVLGFQPTKAYFAGHDHALAVEFLGTNGVMPEAAESKPAPLPFPEVQI